MPDDLRSWLRVRTQIPWHETSDELGGEARGVRDGIDAFAVARDGRGGTPAGGGMRAAWQLARSDAWADRQLSFDLLAGWQRLVLGRPDVPFRTLPAFAKSGRERYGVDEETPTRFEACLWQATEPGTDVPLPSRAARAYLDVCFFHPFDDGNARSALLALGFVMAREHVLLEDVGPIRVPRYADDPFGAQALVRLVRLLAGVEVRRGPADAYSDDSEVSPVL